MHVGPAGDDGLDPGNHDAIRPAFTHVDIRQRLGLLGRALGAVALAVGHGDADGEVVGLRVFDIGFQPLMAFAAGALGDPPSRFPQAIEGVVREIALGAAAILAGETHRFQLVEQVFPAAVDREEAVRRRAGQACGHHHFGVVWNIREVIGEAHGVDPGLQTGLIGHRGNQIAADVDARADLAQRLAILLGGHHHGAASFGLHDIRP